MSFQNLAANSSFAQQQNNIQGNQQNLMQNQAKPQSEKFSFANLAAEVDSNKAQSGGNDSLQRSVSFNGTSQLNSLIGNQDNQSGITFSRQRVSELPKGDLGLNPAPQQQQPAQPTLFNQTAQPAGSSSLFGAQQQQPQASGSSLFGNQTTPANPGQTTSLFGQNASADKSKQTTLTFGQQNQGGTSLFGGQTSQPQQQAATQPAAGQSSLFGSQTPGLFSQGAQQPAAGQSTSLFGAPQGASALPPAPTPSLFGPNTGTQTITPQPQTTSLFGPNPTGFLQPQQQPFPQAQQQAQQPPPPLITSQQQLEENEVRHLVELHKSLVTPESELSLFRGMLYNKYPSEMAKDASERKLLQNHVPTKLENNTVHTDFNKFIGAMKKNQDKDNFYVVQVSTPDQLLQRANATKSNLDQSCEKVNHIKENSVKVREQCQADLQLQIQKAYRKNEEIRSRFIRVFAKLERAMGEQQGILHIDRDKQEQLIARQNNLLSTFRDQLEPACNQVSKVASELQVGTKANNLTEQSTQDGAGINDDDLKHLLGLMQKQKKGIEVLSECAQARNKDLMVMQRELDQIQVPVKY